MEKPLVLIIDDEREMTNFLTDTINEADKYNAVPAYSAKEGFEILKKNKKSIEANKASLILLDIKMPEMDGLQFLEELRKTYKEEELGVIMLTAYEDKDKWDRATSGFVAGYLKKPIGKEDLLATLDHFFSGDSARTNMTLDTFDEHIKKRKEFEREKKSKP